MLNIFSAKEVPKYHGRTPWCDRILKDPFDSADDYSRNWLFFYRSCNPMTKYVCEYSEPDPATLDEFGLKRGLGQMKTEVVDWRTCITTESDVEIVTILNLEDVEGSEKRKRATNLERFVAAALAHQVADVRFDPPDPTTGRNLVLGPDNKVAKVGDSPFKGATIHDLDGDYKREGVYVRRKYLG